MVEVLDRLREIETEVIQTSSAKSEPHIGSIKFLGTKGKKVDPKGITTNGGGRPVRPRNQRIPSFGMGINVGKGATTAQPTSSDHLANQDKDDIRPPGGTGPIRRGAQAARTSSEDPSEDEEDEELEAILALNGVEIREDHVLPTPNANDSEMSWRLTGWMREYAEKILPKGSQSQISQPPAGEWAYRTNFDCFFV